jgi:hypothetical protein
VTEGDHKERGSRSLPPHESMTDIEHLPQAASGMAGLALQPTADLRTQLLSAPARGVDFGIPAPGTATLLIAPMGMGPQWIRCRTGLAADVAHRSLLSSEAPRPEWH